jgi:hypothetical protein
MDLLQWIMTNRPGTMKEHPDRIEIDHDCGEHSTLWLTTGQLCPEALKNTEVFDRYDGADLFSSTFKIASIKEPKFRGEVQLTFTLAEIGSEFSGIRASLPEPTTPFMLQQGIGIYAVGNVSGNIYEWDTELNKLTDNFPRVVDVLAQWLEAIG